VVLSSARAAVARSDVAIAGTLSNPTFGVSTSTQTARLGLSVSVPLPVFGQRATAVRAARRDADVAALDTAVVSRDVRWSVTLAWIDLWEAEQRAQLFALTADYAGRVEHIAVEKFDSGSGPRVDVVRTRAASAAARADREASEREVLAAAARLSPLLALPASTPLATSGEPGFSQELSSAGRLRAHLPAHPVLRRDRAATAAARAHVEDEQRQRWPIVAAQAALAQFDPTLPKSDLTIGLAFDLPVLNQRGGFIEKARAQEKLARAATTLDERLLTADWVDALRRTEAAEARLRALRDEVVPAMREAETMTEEAYGDGRMDLARVLEAQRALLDARMTEIASVAARVRALADLERAMGRDITEGVRAR
jgi:outer membrane protein TolC